jgi:DNA-binding GntR family transcriptional regulator
VVPKVRRETVAEQSVAVIRRQILDRELRPGTPVTEEAMAQALGVSRATVREVLGALAIEGLLTRDPKTRVLQVTTLTRAEVQEIYTARRVLELAGVEAAATASDQELQQLARTVDDMAAAVARRDLAALVEADTRCHERTVAFLGTRYLSDTHSAIMVKLHLAMAQVESADERDENELLAEHREFCDLVLARETAKAQENLLKRLVEAEELVLRSSFVTD